MRLPAVYCLLLTFLLSACLGTQDPAPFTRYIPGGGAGSAGIHTVSSGETLYEISQRYNIAIRDLAVKNDLSPPYRLAAGLRLILPPPQQYKARPGDSLNTVSRLFGVERSEIAKMNDLRPPYRLKAGQVLRLPTVTQKSEPQVFAQSGYEAPPLDAVLPSDPIMVEHLEAPPGQASGLPPVPGEKPLRIAEVKSPPQSPVTAKVPKRAASKFLLPVEGKVISGYGPKDSGLFNDGLNIKSPKGTPVRAAENGVVVYADDALRGSGNLVLIRHEDRWMTAYAHMDKILIKRGAIVKRGETIGTVGSTGSVSDPQLHFEVRRGTEALNPQIYVEG